MGERVSARQGSEGGDLPAGHAILRRCEWGRDVRTIISELVSGGDVRTSHFKGVRE